MVGDEVPVSFPGLRIDPKMDLKVKISQDKPGDDPHDMFSLGSL